MSIFLKLTTDEEAGKTAKSIYRRFHRGVEKNEKERGARQYARIYVPIYAKGRDEAITTIAMNLVRLKKLTYEEIAEICGLTVERVKYLE